MICYNCKKDKGKRMFKLTLIGSDNFSIQCFDCYRFLKKEREESIDLAIHEEMMKFPWMKKGYEYNKKKDEEFEVWMKSVEDLE